MSVKVGDLLSSAARSCSRRSRSYRYSCRRRNANQLGASLPKAGSRHECSSVVEGAIDGRASTVCYGATLHLVRVALLACTHMASAIWSLLSSFDVKFAHSFVPNFIQYATRVTPSDVDVDSEFFRPLSKRALKFTSLVLPPQFLGTSQRVRHKREYNTCFGRRFVTQLATWYTSPPQTPDNALLKQSGRNLVAVFSGRWKRLADRHTNQLQCFACSNAAFDAPPSLSILMKL